MDDTSRTIITSSPAATQQLAARIARSIECGHVIELISDLGGGKTTFVQGMVEALGYVGAVTSPTFTLMNAYSLSSGLVVHHYDLYRLQEGGILASELLEDFQDETIITVIEWGNAVAGVLPDERLRVTLDVIDETARKITLYAGGPLSQQLLQGSMS